MLVSNYEGTLDVHVSSGLDAIPIKSTFRRFAGMQTGWPQAGADRFGDRHFSVFTEKSEHGNVPTTVYEQTAIEYSGGIQYFEPQKVLGPGDALFPGDTDNAEGYDCFASTMIGPVRLLFIAKRLTSGHSYHLLRRHVGEITVTHADKLTTTQNSADFKIYKSDLDFVASVGGQASFENWSPVNSLLLGGLYDVQAQTGSYINFRGAEGQTDTAASNGNGSASDIGWIFSHASDWEEVLFPNGENLGEALVTAGSNLPPVISSAVVTSTGNNGEVVIGYNGSGASPSPKYARLMGVLAGQASAVQQVVSITGTDVQTSVHCEPVLRYHEGDNKVYGFIRTNDDAYPVLWVVGTLGQSLTVTPLAATGCMEESPVFPLVVNTADGERVFFVASGDRSPNDDLGGGPRQIPIYLGTMPWCTAKTGSLANLEVHKVHWAKWNDQIINEATGVQVGSLVLCQDGKTLLTNYSEDAGSSVPHPCSALLSLEIDISRTGMIARNET